MSAKNFADRLLSLMDELQNPCCIGLDTRISFVPSFIKQEAAEKEDDAFEAASDAILEFNRRIVDATYDLVPCYKINSAFYELYGKHGIKAMKKTVKHIKKKGRVIILDVKRNDIGSTAEAYANAYLGRVELCDGTKTKSYFDVDAITVNPYLGSDGVLPFMEACKNYGKGIFVLVKTSNPSSSELQDRTLEQGDVLLFHLVSRKVDEWGQELVGSEYGYSSVGMVVGATFPEHAKICRNLAPRAIVLVPGYGAQGATARDVVHNFNDDGLGAIIHSARGVIAAYKTEKFGMPEEKFEEAARNATIEMIRDVLNALRHENKCRW